MSAMRISTTILESFRLYMTEDWMDESELLATIRGEFTPTRNVDIGQAFGSIIETPRACRVGGGYQVSVRGQEFYFDEAVIAPALECFDRRGLFEVKLTKQYGNSMVVAKADHVYGATLAELKTTLSTFSFEKYADSYQWRFYLDIFEADEILYHVACLSDSEDGITLRGVESFRLYRYRDLRKDCEALLKSFEHYVEMRELGGLLEQRQIEAEESKWASLSI